MKRGKLPSSLSFLVEHRNAPNNRIITAVTQLKREREKERGNEEKKGQRKREILSLASDSRAELPRPGRSAKPSPARQRETQSLPSLRPLPLFFFLVLSSRNMVNGYPTQNSDFCHVLVELYRLHMQGLSSFLLLSSSSRCSR